MYLLLLLCGAAAGGFINGLAGFGTALFTLGFWLQIMEPAEAVSMVLFVTIIAGIPGVWVVRNELRQNQRRLAYFLIPALVGIPFGITSLAFIDAELLKLVIAGFLILYGGFFSFRQNLPTLNTPTPTIDGAIGFLGGVLGGAAGLSGALPTMWCAMRPWSKEQTRAVIQPYSLVVLFVGTLIFAWQGHYDKEALTRIAIALPMLLLFNAIGISVFKRLQDHQFRRLLVSLMLLAGVLLLLRQLL